MNPTGGVVHSAVTADSRIVLHSLLLLLEKQWLKCLLQGMREKKPATLRTRCCGLQPHCRLV